jgi:hypothetical protein
MITCPAGNIALVVVCKEPDLFVTIYPSDLTSIYFLQVINLAHETNQWKWDTKGAFRKPKVGLQQHRQPRTKRTQQNYTSHQPPRAIPYRRAERLSIVISPDRGARRDVTARWRRTSESLRGNSPGDVGLAILRGEH